MLNTIPKTPELGQASRRAVKAAALTIELAGGLPDTCTMSSGSQFPTCIHHRDWNLLLLPTTCEGPIYIAEAIELVRRLTRESALIVRLDTSLEPPVSFVTFDAVLRSRGDIVVMRGLLPCARAGDCRLGLVRHGASRPALILGSEGSVANAEGAGDDTWDRQRHRRCGHLLPQPHLGRLVMVKAVKQPCTKKSTNRANAGAKRTPAGRPSLSPYLYLNPLGSYPNFTWGVLRRKFGPDGRENSAEEFGRLKLHPVNPPPAGEPWRSPCKWAVLLPDDASDTLWDPQRLLASFDANALPWVPELLAYITVRFESPRLHVVWRRVLEWSQQFLVGRNLPVVAVLHVPAEVGSPNRPHIHIICPLRTLGGTGHGWGVYDQQMSHDEGQVLTWRSWMEFNK